MEKIYRIFHSDDLIPFIVREEESDILILSKKNLKRKAEKVLSRIRSDIKRYISSNSFFKDSLSPINPDNSMPEIIRKMCEVSIKTGIGPMAGIAGAIAEEIGKELLHYTDEVIVENGGDIFIKTEKDRIIGIYTENEKFKNFAIKIKSKNTPLGICSSSSYIGHSLSFGKAELTTVISKDTVLADSLATLIGNKVTDKNDLDIVMNEVSSYNIIGAFAIKDDRIAILGEIEFVEVG